MSHDLPNMIGVKQAGVEDKVRSVLPGYMAMGEAGMGGMFTILKVRDGLTNYADPGFYQHPAGTGAKKVPTPA